MPYTITKIKFRSPLIFLHASPISEGQKCGYCTKDTGARVYSIEKGSIAAKFPIHQLIKFFFTIEIVISEGNPCPTMFNFNIASL